jgi:dolichol-phosphate mannosyltransferase
VHSSTTASHSVDSHGAVPELSVVIPLYDEAPNVAGLLTELRDALMALDVPSEVIAVDDGSSDGTWRALREAAARWPTLRLARLDTNRGQAAALWHGFGVARGTWIATLDGDGQNPPADLVRLWAARTGADMIAGVRVDRRDVGLRRVMSRVANTVRRTLLHDGVRDSGCATKLFRREMVEDFLPIRTLYSFMPAFAVARGWRVMEIDVTHRPRRAGRSKYGLRAMALRPLVDMLVVWWTLRRGGRTPRR